MNFIQHSSTKNIALSGILIIIWLLGLISLSLAQGDIWTEKASMPTARLGFGTAVVDGKIYAIGGLRTETVALKVVEVYDPSTDSWDNTKEPMPTARGTFGCTVVDGKIYAIGGGVVGSYNLSIVEVYDPVTDTWDTSKAPMPTARSAVAACFVNGKIYVIGGTTETAGILGGTGIVEEYDPVTNTWARKTDKPTPGWGLRACVFEEKIYVTGGNVRWPDITAALDVYDPVTDSWDTLKTPMAKKRYSHSMSLTNGKIYIFGGWKSSGGGPIYKTVEEYDPTTDIWTNKTDMPFAIAEFGAAVVDMKIYLVGGTSTLHPFTSINKVYEYDPALDVTDIEDFFTRHPLQFSLNQNYPNPFNPDTRISYAIPKQSHVVLKVMNVLGQEVRTLVKEEKPAGYYEVLWDGKNVKGQRAASGVYLYQLESRDFIQTRKMLLLQ